MEENINENVTTTERKEEKDIFIPKHEETNKKESKKSCESKKKCCCTCKIIFYIFLILAIAGAYVLHFCCPQSKHTNSSYVAPVGEPGNGDVIFINLDSISEHYELMKILTADIESEVQKQTAIFDNKEKAFKSKYAQFQKNYESGVLTEVQIQNASQQLQAEYERIMAERESVLTDLDNRQVAALTQVMDSLKNTAIRLNNERFHASYILSYKEGAQILYGDPTKDVTADVLEELNKSYAK